VKHALGHSDPTDAQRLLPGTRLLWLRGGDDVCHPAGVWLPLRL